MTRVKRGITSLKHRRKILGQTKGFRWGRKSKERLAKEALPHAGVHRFQDLRKKKRNFRKLWQIKINAASREHGPVLQRFYAQIKTRQYRLKQENPRRTRRK